MTKKPTLINSIRAKLISAVAMLLVAVIMVVSSTYAWFTLSTAPEITGITTAIGANGALEMALRYGTTDAPREGIVAAGDDVNTYWGNLVALGTTDTINYGVDKIVLLPSMLNVSDEGILSGSMLSTPAYGPDGRITGVAANTVSGKYDMTDGAFFDNSDFGFRGIGVASGMTDRQLSYRAAKSAASIATAQAKNVAANSLNVNGSTLANIAIKKAVDDNAKFDNTNVDSLLTIVNDLLGTADTTGALQYIEQAYMQYVLAFAAGEAGGTASDTVWNAIKSAVEAPGATIDSVLAVLTTGQGKEVPSEIATPLDAYRKTLANVQSAKTGLEALKADTTKNGSYTWDDIKTPLFELANVMAMEVNGIPAQNLKDDDNMSTLVNSVASGGLVVTMTSGGGVYADIADHCGDYNASVVIEEVSYGGVTLKNMNARMETASTIASSATGHYLKIAGDMLMVKSPEFAGSADDVKPLTEFYGYVIDMSFRTNAAESNLLLQTEAVDRIYGDNANEQTMGGGSTMTFASTSSNFTNDNVKALMKHIRIVFFTPGDTAAAGGTVLAYAKLDVENATVGADGVTAGMYLYKSTVTTEIAKDENNNILAGTAIKYYYNTADQKYYADAAFSGTAVDEATINTDASVKVTKTTETKLTDDQAIITALTQNAITNVSALVYLDGTTMTNKDVAYDTASSMTGKTNFQFSSSATLVPMEYANLHTPGAGSETTAAPVTPNEPQN